MDIEELYSIFTRSNGITTDTRQIIADSIYFALKGQQFDGNSFADDALNSGASFAVVDDPSLEDRDNRYIFTRNSLQTLQELARFHRLHLGTKIIGITGTNGKTTTKELVNAVLSSHLDVVATKGNLNNHIGVPLTLLALTESTEIGIIEMGANHPGEIAELCDIALPDYGIITNIGKAHLEGFGDQDTIIETKKALYVAVKQRNGIVFVNGDNDLLLTLAKGIDKVSYGISEKNDICGGITGNHPYLELFFQNKATNRVRTRLAGAYNFENVMAAVSCGVYFNIPEVDIVSSLEAYTPSNNRSQVKKTERNLLILDAYNANPTSVRNAIQNFGELEYPDKVVILGDMLELGESAEAEHKAILELLENLGGLSVILVGPVFNKVCSMERATRFEDVAQAKAALATEPLIGKTILVKGSRGIHLETLNDVL